MTLHVMQSIIERRLPSLHMPLLVIHWPPVVGTIRDSSDGLSRYQYRCPWCMQDTWGQPMLQGDECRVLWVQSRGTWKFATSTLKTKHVWKAGLLRSTLQTFNVDYWVKYLLNWTHCQPSITITEIKASEVLLHCILNGDTDRAWWNECHCRALQSRTCLHLSQ